MQKEIFGNSLNALDSELPENRILSNHLWNIVGHQNAMIQQLRSACLTALEAFGKSEYSAGRTVFFTS